MGRVRTTGCPANPDPAEFAQKNLRRPAVGGVQPGGKSPQGTAQRKAGAGENLLLTSRHRLDVGAKCPHAIVIDLAQWRCVGTGDSPELCF